MRITTLLSALLFGTVASTTLAQSTAFTYQGQLKNGAGAASGVHDFRFRLYDSAAAGTQLGSQVCVNNLLVSSGVVTATVDFGQQFASSSARYIEIDVRADTGLDCSNSAGFVTLTPRQLLTAAPSADHANSAFSMDAPNGQHPNAVFVASTGNVGIGTSTPSAPLHVMMPVSGAAAVRIQGLSSTAANTAFLSFANSAGSDTGYVGD